MDDTEESVCGILKPLLHTSDKSKIEDWIAEFVKRVSSLSGSKAVSEQCDLVISCAQQLATTSKGKRSCLTSNKICCLSDVLKGHSRHGVWPGGIASRRGQLRQDHCEIQKTPCLLVAELTALPHRPDLFTHTPGSLFLQDSSASILCELTNCNPTWIDNVVVVPAWNFVSVDVIPSLAITGNNEFGLISGGYFEVLLPCIPCITKEQFLIHHQPSMTVAELSSVPTGKSQAGCRFNIRGNVTSMSPVYRNGSRPCYFFVEICDAVEGDVVTIVIMTSQHLHWIYLIWVQEEVMITELKMAVRKRAVSNSTMLLCSTDASELATPQRYTSSVSTPSCSTASSSSIPNASSPTQPTARRASTGSPRPVTRSQACRSSEETCSSGPPSRGRKRSRSHLSESPPIHGMTTRRQAMSASGASPVKNSSPLSKVENIAPVMSPHTPMKSAMAGVELPTAVHCPSTITKTLCGKHGAKMADVSLAEWTMSTQQLKELGQVMMEAESLYNQHPGATSTPTNTRNANGSYHDRNRPSPGTPPFRSPPAKRPRSSVRSSPSPTHASGSLLASGCSPGVINEKVHSQPSYTLPENSEPFCVIPSYQATITCCKNANIGIFMLNEDICLQCAHQSSCHWCRGWREGTLLQLNNVHLLHTPSETGPRVTLSCCSVSTVRVSRFSPSYDLSYPFFAEGDATAYHAWQLNCLQYSQYVQLTRVLESKFCPYLKRERVVGVVAGGVRMKGFEKALGGKHDGVADSAMRALWLSQTDTPKVISADSHDWTQSGPTPPPSSPCHAARDPMLEFCSYPHTCGVIGKPFASVSVPSLKDLVSKVVALAYERRTWHASNGEEIGAVGSSNRGIKWRYSVISPGDFIEPQAIIGVLAVSLHSGRLQLRDQTGHVDVVLASVTGECNSPSSHCYLHTKCYPSANTGPSGRQSSGPTLACGICSPHEALPEHLGSIWCVRNAMFVVEDISQLQPGDPDGLQKNCAVYAVFSLADMQWLYPPQRRKNVTSTASLVPGAGKNTTQDSATQSKDLPSSSADAGPSGFLVSQVKPCQLVLDRQGVVGLQSSIVVQLYPDAAACDMLTTTGLSYAGLHGEGMHWYPVLHPGRCYRVASTSKAAIKLGYTWTSIDSAAISVETDLAGSTRFESYPGKKANGGSAASSPEILSVRDMLAVMGKELLTRSSGKAVEKSLSFCGVIVSHDVNASRNTAAHKRDEASAPPLLKRTTSAMSAVPSSHAHVQGGSVQHVDRKGFHQRRVYVSGCGWMYVDVLKTHGLFDCLLEHFAIITVRDCQYLDSAKIFLALDKNPYSLGLLPGATVVFHNAVVKCTRSGDVTIQINKGTTRVTVEALPLVPVKLPPPSSSASAESSLQHLSFLASEWRRGICSTLVHSVQCSVVAIQQVTVGMRCATCGDFLRQTCPHDDGSHGGYEAYAEARVIVDDGTAEAVLYAHDDRVRALLLLSAAEWQKLLHMSLETGPMMYQRSAFIPGQPQDARFPSSSTSELERIILSPAVCREVLLHCSMLRIRQQAIVQEASVRIGRQAVTVSQYQKVLLRAVHVAAVDYRSSLIHLLSKVR